MGNILVVGSINIDVIIRVSHIPSVGETILARSIKFCNGGKGANQATAIAKLKSKVSMLGKIGNDEYGKKLYRELRESGVDVSRIEVDNGSSTGMAYVNVSDDGNNNIIVIPGANAKVDIDYIYRNKDIFDKINMCVLQLEIPLDTVLYVAKLCREKDIKIILNPAPACRLPDDLLRNIYILTPNEVELSVLTGIKTDVLSDVEKASEILLKKGIKYVITTRGDKGSFLASNSEMKAFNAIDIKKVDTTGAGDSFTGGLAVALNEGKDIKEAIEFATCVAALTISKEGAQASLPTRDEVENFMVQRQIL